MENKEIIEGNVLIAIFDGWILDDTFPDKGRTYTKNGAIELDTTFKYHKDWNMLMEVVERIESLEDIEKDTFNVNITKCYCEIYGKYCDSQHPRFSYYRAEEKHGDSKHISTFKAVVQFITWYNSNK